MIATYYGYDFKEEKDFESFEDAKEWLIRRHKIYDFERRFKAKEPVSWFGRFVLFIWVLWVTLSVFALIWLSIEFG